MSEESSLANEHIGYAQMHQVDEAGGFMRMRIDPEPVLRELEFYMRGLRVVGFREEDGESIPMTERVGEPMMNELGIMRTRAYLLGVINSQTVQGNLSEDQFCEMVRIYRQGLAKWFVGNRFIFEIKDNNPGYLTDALFPMVKVFLSRTVENKERDSYSTHKITEKIGETAREAVSRLPFGWGR